MNINPELPERPGKSFPRACSVSRFARCGADRSCAKIDRTSSCSTPMTTATRICLARMYLTISARLMWMRWPPAACGRCMATAPRRSAFRREPVCWSASFNRDSAWNPTVGPLDGFDRETDDRRATAGSAGYVTAQFGKWHLGPGDRDHRGTDSNMFMLRTPRDPLPPTSHSTVQDRVMSEVRPPRCIMSTHAAGRPLP